MTGLDGPSTHGDTLPHQAQEGLVLDQQDMPSNETTIQVYY